MTDRTAARKKQRERQFHSARDFEASSSQIGEVVPLAEDIRRRTQLLIAGNAKGRSRKKKIEDAEELMRMLGVHPEQSADTGIEGILPAPTLGTPHL